MNMYPLNTPVLLCGKALWKGAGSEGGRGDEVLGLPVSKVNKGEEGRERKEGREAPRILLLLLPPSSLFLS